jgi:hypothetical protein
MYDQHTEKRRNLSQPPLHIKQQANTEERTGARRERKEGGRREDG